MNINGLVVSCQYSDLFQYGIARWYNYLHSLTVVTDYKDTKTLELLARYPDIRVHQTDIFYANGAKFNKGAAMEEARLGPNAPDWADWMLFFDADIIPEYAWYEKIEHMGDNLDRKTLYGAKRFQANSPQDIDKATLQLIPDAPCDGGYFHMFHSSTIPKRDIPLLETWWPHAGVYDSHFKNRWSEGKRYVLPIKLTHLGDRENWCGRGNTEAMTKLIDERRRRGTYLHERMAE
jgi:hypothetical protein